MIPNFKYPTPIDKEVDWDKSKTIMSRTDAAGVIDYVNQVFCDVCGYSEEELMGSPHNIIRHPDMPRVIFKVLWDNIQRQYTTRYKLPCGGQELSQIRRILLGGNGF